MCLIAETIRQLFLYPDSLANRFHAVAIGCKYCRSLETYILHKDFPGHNPKDTVVLAPDQYGDVVGLKSLECSEENCGTLLPVFAQFASSTPVEERKAMVDSWRWDNLQCPKGHAIPRQGLY
jgi:hypothetical protein